MEKKNYIVAIDLGSHNVTAAAAVRGADGKMVIEAVVREKSEGVSSGAIDNIELAAKSLKTAVDKLQEQLNIKVFEAYFGISGEFIRCASHNDWVAVGDYSNGVSQSDVDELYARMEKVSAPSEDEVILERIPQNFVVDGNKEVPNPVGSFGKSLSSTFNFILSLRTPIQRLTNAVLKLGIKPLAIHVNPLVTAETLLESDEKEEGIAVVDMGADVTDVTIYFNNVVRYVASIPIGSNAINTDIRTLSIPERWVEKMKVKYGNAVAANVKEDAGIGYNTPKGKKMILQCNLAAVIEARVQDIADLVVKEIKDAGFDKKLPYGIVLTGGGANLEGIADAFTKHTGIDTRIGVPEMVVDEESAEKVDGPEYATITGLLWNALQGGAYCMVDQRPTPAQPAQPVQPAQPTPQPVKPTFVPPVPPTPAPQPAPQRVAPTPAPAPAPAPQPVKPQTINERYGAQQQTVAQPASTPAPTPAPAPAPEVKSEPTPAPEIAPEAEDQAPKEKKGGLFEGLKKLGKKATELLERMDSNNDDDII